MKNYENHIFSLRKVDIDDAKITKKRNVFFTKWPYIIKPALDDLPATCQIFLKDGLVIKQSSKMYH